MENRIEDVEEIDTLIAELEISKGKGNLILCVVNSPLYRDRIIQTLRGRFTSKVIGVTNGKQIIDILKRKKFDGAHVLMWNMPEEATEDLLNTLNNFRELFYEVNIPNIVFYNQGFSESVIRKAPDFWRYRGNYYEFKEIEGGLTFEALEALITPLTYIDKDDLLRRKRINEYLLKKVRDKKEKSNILSELGVISYYLGELDVSLNYHKKALELDEELENKVGITKDFGNIGAIYGNKGELDKALEFLDKALKLDEELGRKEEIAIYLGNMGAVYGKKGELDKALEFFKKALRLDEELGRKEGIAVHLGNMGAVYGKKGELDKALDYYEKALKLDEELERKEGIATRLGNIGVVYGKRGELDKALEYYEKALDIFNQMGNRIENARVLRNIGDIFVLKKDIKRAMDYYLEAQNLAKGSYIFEDINKRLQIFKKKVIFKDNQKSTKVKAMP
ncbi:MAG: tetratricopeptide repeat protein [Candidatus Methanoperedens sp.]|nr:tetratricopeptide repeat protein [Candidatus Methanoperedens sp.]